MVRISITGTVVFNRSIIGDQSVLHQLVAVELRPPSDESLSSELEPSPGMSMSGSCMMFVVLVARAGDA